MSRRYESIPPVSYYSDPQERSAHASGLDSVSFPSFPEPPPGADKRARADFGRARRIVARWHADHVAAIGAGSNMPEDRDIVSFRIRIVDLLHAAEYRLQARTGVYGTRSDTYTAWSRDYQDAWRAARLAGLNAVVAALYRRREQSFQATGV